MCSDSYTDIAGAYEQCFHSHLLILCRRARFFILGVHTGVGKGVTAGKGLFFKGFGQLSFCLTSFGTVKFCIKKKSDHFSSEGQTWI